MANSLVEQVRPLRLFIGALLFLQMLAFSMSCGGSSPTVPSPPPIPAANLVSQGDLRFPSCTSTGCTFEGEARNQAAGCATNVRGLTRLFDTTNQQLDSSEWTLARTRRIQPNEAFLYDGCCFRRSDIDKPGYYRTEVFWDNTSCS